MTDDKVQGYWHVYSDGKRADIPFGSEEDKIFAMNNIAICAYRYGMEVICLEVNDTHLHIIVKGWNIDRFLSGVKRRFTLHYNAKNNQTTNDIFLAAGEIQTRSELLVKIIYTFRNGLDFYQGAPWEYRWGVGNTFFARRTEEGTPLSELPVRAQRELFNCRQKLPQFWRVDADGLILPSSYIDAWIVERLFGSVRAFLAFLHIKKDDELKLKQGFATNYIQQRSIQDMRDRARKLSRQKFGKSLRVLPFKSRLEIAGTMMKLDHICKSESLAKAVYLTKEDLDRLL